MEQIKFEALRDCLKKYDITREELYKFANSEYKFIPTPLPIVLKEGNELKIISGFDSFHIDEIWGIQIHDNYLLRFNSFSEKSFNNIQKEVSNLIFNGKECSLPKNSDVELIFDSLVYNYDKILETKKLAIKNGYIEHTYKLLAGFWFGEYSIYFLSEDSVSCNNLYRRIGFRPVKNSQGIREDYILSSNINVNLIIKI